MKQTLDTFLALAKFSLQIWTTNPGANLRSGRSDARPPFVQKKEIFLKKLVTFGLQSILTHSFQLKFWYKVQQKSSARGCLTLCGQELTYRHRWPQIMRPPVDRFLEWPLPNVVPPVLE